MGTFCGELTAGDGGNAGASLIGIRLFAVAYLTEDAFDCLGIVFGLKLYETSVDADIGVASVFEADGVAVMVGEDGVAFFPCGFCELVEATGLAHLISGD